MPNLNRDYIDFSIRFLWHRMSKMYNEIASEHGITINIGAILLNVDREGTPSTQLGPKMGMEPTSLSRSLKVMEADGLIERVCNQKDKRKVMIVLTPLGFSKRNQIKELVVAFNKTLCDSIEKEKLDVFYEVLLRINESIEKELTQKLNELKNE